MMLHNNKVIAPLEFTNSVSPGMVIEMSIVLLQDASEYRTKKCPQCGHVNNISITGNDGWIQWEILPELNPNSAVIDN